jgi:hypothetical protein
VNVDEFEHTEVEHQARRDQQRVLSALARHKREHRRDPEVQREGNDVTQAAFQSPYAQDVDDTASGGPPTHPTRLSDGGGTDIGGVGSRQTQDTGTNSNPPLWVVPAGWIANGAGGWTSPDGAHWGTREKPPLELANNKEDQQRALQRREDRMRRSSSSADDRDEYAPGQFTDEEDDDTTPLERRSNQRMWYTLRWGDPAEHISDEITRQ